jgi:hypothetical protein
MNAKVDKWSGVNPPTATSKTAHYVFWGSVIGLFAGLATLFAVSTYYGALTGLEAANCVALGSVMTVMLSQPVGLGGLVVGAACGGLCAAVARAVHHS